MLIEFHRLMNYPPCAPNRDQNGSPKMCVIADTNRLYHSSQCQKRAWRMSPLFREALGEDALGIRTRRMPDLVGSELRKRGISAEHIDAVKPILTAIANKSEKVNDDGITAQVVFYAPQDIAAIADAVESVVEDLTPAQAKKVKAKDLNACLKTIPRPVTPDIALWGRMVTTDGIPNIDAAMQVAPEISTNQASSQMDFFVAMDDLMTGRDMEDTGAAMMGDAEFGSACFYAYSVVDVDALKANLLLEREPEDAGADIDLLVRRTVEALLRTMAFTVPSGAQNNFAAYPAPSAIYVVARKQQPMSLANAFADPARRRNGTDLVHDSIAKLTGFIDASIDQYGIPAKARVWFSAKPYDDLHPEHDEVKTVASVPALVDTIMGELG